VVTTLLDASWPVRIGLVVLAIVIGLAWVVFKNRREIANAAGAAAPADAATAAPPDAATAAPADPAPKAPAVPMTGAPTPQPPTDEPPTDPAA
jgi:hypothetical protein